jgi:hypothetical protein
MLLHCACSQTSTQCYNIDELYGKKKYSHL